MASPLFMSYDRTLRRMHMMSLVGQMADQRKGGFRASLVVNAHTGLPLVAETPAAAGRPGINVATDHAPRL